MALVICPECEHQVSSSAFACPRCVYPMSRSSTTGPVREPGSSPLARGHGARTPSQVLYRSPFLIGVVAASSASLMGNLIGVPLLVSLFRTNHYFAMALILAADLGLFALAWIFRGCRSSSVVLGISAGALLLVTLGFLTMCTIKPPKTDIVDNVGFSLLLGSVVHWAVTLGGGLVAGAA